MVKVNIHSVRKVRNVAAIIGWVGGSMAAFIIVPWQSALVLTVVAGTVIAIVIRLGKRNAIRWKGR